MGSTQVSRATGSNAVSHATTGQMTVNAMIDTSCWWNVGYGLPVWLSPWIGIPQPAGPPQRLGRLVGVPAGCENCSIRVSQL